MCRTGTVSVTYTDVHAERLAFFQDMLKPRHGDVGKRRAPPCWPPDAPFYLATGRVRGGE